MRKIVILGQMWAGKSTFLESIALQKQSNVQVFKEVEYQLRRLEVKDLGSSKETLIFETYRGAVWDKESNIPKLLEQAEIVLYFFSTTDLAEIDEISESDISGYLEALNGILRIAKTVNKSLTEIPWIFVLNKFDLDSREPFSKYLSKYDDFKVFQISALEGIGVNTLMKEVIKTLKII